MEAAAESTQITIRPSDEMGLFKQKIIKPVHNFNIQLYQKCTFCKTEMWKIFVLWLGFFLSNKFLI